MSDWFNSLTFRQQRSLRIFQKIGEWENRLAMSKLPFRKYNFMYPAQTKTLRPLCWVLGHFPLYHDETRTVYCNMCDKTFPKETETLG